MGHSKGTSCRTPLAKILDPPLVASDLLIFLRVDRLQCVSSADKCGGLVTIWRDLCPRDPSVTPAPTATVLLLYSISVQIVLHKMARPSNDMPAGFGHYFRWSYVCHLANYFVENPGIDLRQFLIKCAV